ncbi:transcriptional regulator [Anabaena sp. FACHB-1237]|uniref:P-II family nitrogen regulator n=1 Tax=Anabaena sp. FACHB-1237 TaxID=2692769 RepID=UPI00168084DE|nr:P-II family nitrogen regulator [Anabaena sp. FACHB-1237]MBD2138676.1 transcriptional regulator [Anabaena sp. FACHB-1237]
MQAVKKIEIITNSLELQKVLQILDDAGVSGYTIIEDVTGKGHRGRVIDDLESHALTNAYVITICDEEKEHQVVEAIRPIIKKYGGVCIVSDAQSIVH